MATLKVVVTALQRYWAAGRCWEAGETEAVLEDLPGLPLETQLAQLDAAKGGAVLQQNELGRSNPEQRAPCVLTYRIVQDPPSSPAVTECCTTPEAEKAAAEADAAAGEQSASQTQPPAAGEPTATEPPQAT